MKSVRVFVLLVIGFPYAQAQVTTGTILGTVRDESGAAIPGTLVTVTNERTGATRSFVTDERGDYAFPALSPSSYTVRAKLTGFKAFEVQGKTLPVGQEVRVDIALQVGEVTEQVTVFAEAPLIETETSALTHVVDQKKILELPLNGRNFLELAALSAGSSPKTPFRVTQFGNRNQYVTIGGGRDSSTNYLIDGVEARSLRFNNSSIQPSVDAIQEFKVERNSFSAEYGRGVAVVNVAIRSGSNQLHGSVYEFLRNDLFDARNFFDQEKPPYRQNQFGFSIGGPIVREKSFFFGNYEGLRVRKGQTLLGIVPDPRRLAGDFTGLGTVYDPLSTRPNPAQPGAIVRDPFPGNVIPRERIDPFASLYGSLYPAPNLAGRPPFNFVNVLSDVHDSDQFNIRLDYRFSENDSLFGRYTFYDGTQLIPEIFQLTPRPQKGQNFALQQTHIFSPTMVNELRLGYNRAIHWTRPLPALGDRNIVQELGLENLGGLKPDLFGIPSVAITGFTNRGENTLNQGAVENIYTISNKLNLARGRHNAKIGFEYQDIRYQQQGEVTPRGSFVFNGVFTGPSGTTQGGVPLADFLLGYPFQSQAGLGDALFNLSSRSFAVFLQDDVKVTPNFTLNLGLRWQYDSPMKEENFKEGVFAENVGLIAYSKEPSQSIYPGLQDKFLPGASVRRGINDPDWNNFAPRIGFAFRPFGNAKTVIRSGFGVFYDNVNGNEWQFFGLLPPFYQIHLLVSPTDFPRYRMDEMFPDLSQFTDIPAPFSTFREDRTPYTMQWNLNLQRTLTRDVMIEVAYAGSAGRKLWKRFNQNQAIPDPSGRIPIQERVPYPLFQAGLLTSGRDSNSSYHAASVRLEKAFSAGVSFQSVYTWARNLDWNSGEFEANQTRFRWDKRADRGLSRYHQAHRSVSNFAYLLPFGRGQHWGADFHGVGGKLLEGWQVNGILVFSTGFPLTISANAVHGTGSFIPQFADRVADGNLTRGERGPERWFDTNAFVRPGVGTLGNSGRNVIIGPGVNNIDFSVLKNTGITERVTLQFRAEFFNLFNHPLFAEPDTNVDSTAFGRISRAGAPREIQFGLKFLF
jgi:Carboxypeptidase regulatory-like domain/TonB-dependent Receptor Plug Domain/TonB dependent receptor